MISSEEWRNIYKKPVGIKLYVCDLKETNINVNSAFEFH